MMYEQFHLGCIKEDQSPFISLYDLLIWEQLPTILESLLKLASCVELDELRIEVT